MKKLLFIILSVAFLAGCDKKIDEYPASSNGVDFSNYVAVGNSLTSGHSDNALYLSGQQRTLPEHPASSFKPSAGALQAALDSPPENGVDYPSRADSTTITKLALKIIRTKTGPGNRRYCSLKPGGRC